MPTVSVIVPCYNHARFLHQRMASIVGQTFQDMELILLDDASTDGSPAVLDTYRADSRVAHAEYNRANSGSPFAQWRRGIELARGEWIWIAESDDWASPTFLEAMLLSLRQHPECGLAYCLSEMVNAEGRPVWRPAEGGAPVATDGRRFAMQTLALANVIVNASGVLFRRELYDATQQHLYTTMRLCGDWMFYTLLALRTGVLQVPTVLNHCRRHGANVAERAEAQALQFTEGIRVLDHIIAHTGLTPARYARHWGREWAKAERKYRYPAPLRHSVRRALRHHPAIVGWHTVYKAKYRLCHA